ncbi:MAG: hypothetical protein JXJ04_09800 [Spirochaetales bacterium]|nr:hypothetical protein [Spirochaetales bacterium]
MKQFIIFFIIFFFISHMAGSQTHLAVNLDHPVYTILEIASIKGILQNLSHAKPYSRSMVLICLKKIDEKRNLFNSSEQTMIGQMLKEFQDSQEGIHNGNIPFKGPLGNVMIGMKSDGTTHLNINDLDAWHMDTALSFYLKGNIASFLSYYGSFGGTFDKVSPDSFEPYSFTKKWDSFHIGFGEPRYSLEGIESTPYFSFRLEDEISAEFFNSNLLIRLARFRRDWGFSQGNLYLSESARPYEGFDLYTKLASSLALSYTVGSLSDWKKEDNRLTQPENISYQKMFTLQMLEFFPTEWLTLSIAASAIWGKRFELGYMNPLLYPVIYQNVQGNFDNVAQSVNIIFQIPHYSRFYFSFYADEMEFSDIEHFFSNPRNMVAFQLGAKIPVPIFSFTLITLQYTKIEPFVYAHYPEENYASFSAPVDVSYTNDGENLGSHLPPNSDEFFISIESGVYTNMRLTLQYRLIRHGSNDKDALDHTIIYGDVEEYFHYDEVDQYPDKLFLADGLYDWNNIFSIEIAVDIPKYNSTIIFGYSFSYTWWVKNESTLTPPDSEAKNIFALSYKIFQ